MPDAEHGGGIGIGSGMGSPGGGHPDHGVSGTVEDGFGKSRDRSNPLGFANPHSGLLDFFEGLFGPKEPTAYNMMSLWGGHWGFDPGKKYEPYEGFNPVDFFDPLDDMDYSAYDQPQDFALNMPMINKNPMSMHSNMPTETNTLDNPLSNLSPQEAMEMFGGPNQDQGGIKGIGHGGEGI